MSTNETRKAEKLSVPLTVAEHATIVRLAASRSLEAGRPVSAAAMARELMTRGLEATRSSDQKAAA